MASSILIRRTLTFNKTQRIVSRYSIPIRSESSYSPVAWWRNRQETKHATAFKDRLMEMASSERWVLSDMQKELMEASSSWAAKMPIIKQQKEIKAAQQMNNVVSAIVSVCGEDADIERLEKMERKEKLQAALKAGVSVEEINQTVQRFQMTTLMHKAVRICKEQGKPIPTTQEGIQTLVQSMGMNLLTKEQKKKFGKAQAKQMMRRGR